jgi:hypothetical protein
MINFLKIRYILYLGVLLIMFLSTSVAAKLGIMQVGTFSSIILVALFMYIFFTHKINIKFKPEFQIIFVGFLIIFIKVMLGQYDQIKLAIFFVMIPMFISVVLGKQRNFSLKFLQNLILFFFVLECFLAIYERITLSHIFPLSEEIRLITIEDLLFRSSSFLGHPLNNALCVSVIMGFILCSNIKSLYKIVYLLLGFIAILCFNARAAIIIWGVLLTIHFLKIVLNKRTKNTIRVLILLFFSFLIYSVYIVITDFGFGGRLLKSEIMDGSANTRLEVLDAFKFINTNDLIFGDANNYISVMNKLGAGGVENSYIVFIIQYGLIITLILILLYAQLISRFLKNYSFYDRFILLSSFILLGSTNNGLASATPLIFFILCYYSFQKFDTELKILTDDK